MHNNTDHRLLSRDVQQGLNNLWVTYSMDTSKQKVSSYPADQLECVKSVLNPEFIWEYHLFISNFD